MFLFKSWSISIKIVKVKRVLCNNWPLDGSPKAFHGTVAWRAGPLQGCLAHPDRVHEQSVLACKSDTTLTCSLDLYVINEPQIFVLFY